MESIGEKLRAARESKKLTIKEIVKETNISTSYLEALEEEKFDKFPSETYLIGFLRSYAEYLKIDVESIIQSYKGYKIGESITPLEELTKPTKSNLMLNASSFVNKYKSVLFVGFAALAVILIIGGIRAIFKSDVDISENDSMETLKTEINSDKKNEIENLRNLQLENDKGYIFVYKKEAVQFLVDKKEIVFLLKEIKGKTVKIEFLPGNRIENIEMENPKKLAIDGCPRDITLTLKGLTENRAKIMVTLGEKTKIVEKEEILEKDDPLMQGDNTSVVALNKKNLKIVFIAEFKQKSFIELYLDGVRKMRGFMPEGTRQRWEASEYIQIKIGNAGGLDAKINGKAYNFGRSGQIANKVITWKKDVNNPNLYHIVVNDW